MFKQNGILKLPPPSKLHKMLATGLKFSFLLGLMCLMQGCYQTTRGTATSQNVRAILRPVCVPPIRYSVSKDTARTVEQIRQRNQTCVNEGF